MLWDLDEIEITASNIKLLSIKFYIKESEVRTESFGLINL